MSRLPTLELVLERRYFKPTYTIGRWLVEGMELCDSLEDKDRGLTQEMSSSEIYKTKVYGSTCIPYGRYEIVLSQSPKLSGKTYGKKYGGLVPEVLNVPGFTGIRIHPGNSPADTLGCLLPGENKQVGKLLNSTQAYYDLMDYYLVPAYKRGQRIFITITKKT